MVIHKDLVAPFGCQRAYYFNSCRFSNAVEKFGLETTGIECLSHGRKGFRLTLCSGEREYEVLLDNIWVRLTLVGMHLPRRVLSEGGAASQEVWERFVQVIKQWEER